MKIKKVNATTVRVCNTKVSLNNMEEYKNPGTDYYVYKNDSSFYLSSSKNSKDVLVGGFHYGLIPENFKAINNISKKRAKKIRGINHYSIWTPSHKPICNPEGMVYIPKLDIWVDIYLTNSDAIECGTSRANKNILAGGSRYGRKMLTDRDKVLYEDFKKIGRVFSKRMITENEFQIAMYGVKENASSGDLDDGTTKHISDFTSKYGIEQATGVQWIWSKDKYKKHGNTAVILGGCRVNGVDSGSWNSNWSNYVWYSNWDVGSRFACDHLKPNNEAQAELKQGEK